MKEGTLMRKKNFSTSSPKKKSKCLLYFCSEYFSIPFVENSLSDVETLPSPSQVTHPECTVGNVVCFRTISHLPKIFPTSRRPDVSVSHRF